MITYTPFKAYGNLRYNLASLPYADQYIKQSEYLRKVRESKGCDLAGNSAHVKIWECGFTENGRYLGYDGFRRGTIIDYGLE